MPAAYDDLIQGAARQYNIDPALIRALVMVESGGNPAAVSPKGAQGLGQLMPATATSLGVKDPHDPVQAIPAIARLLDENLTRYGNVEDALRAYHGGTDQKNWGPLTNAYQGKVLAKLSQPAKNLPGIPGGQGGASDDEIFNAFMVGSPAGATSDDDKIFDAFVKQPTATAESRAEDGALVLGMGGTTPEPEKNPVVAAIEGVGRTTKNALRGAYQGLTDLPVGLGQALAHHQQDSMKDAFALIDQRRGTNLTEQLDQKTAGIDRYAAAREADYQRSTPGSIAAGLGRIAGGAAPFLAMGPAAAAPIVQGAAMGERLLSAAPALGRLGGATAGGAFQGAGFGAATPVTEGPYDAGQLANARLGAVLGGVLPAAGAGLRGLGRGVGNAAGANVAPEVGALAKVAQKHGIDLRPDQLVNSKPINALSAALDYVPFSGKGASLTKQQKQFNTAISRTIGENTDNVTQAVKDAERRLGAEFDRVLKNTTVKADQSFQGDLGQILTNARNEMTDPQYSVMVRQVENILGKVKPGDVIDADAAYNIKKGLDRLSKSSDSTLAYYARETRNSLMDALNRSLPDKGAEFAKTRRQWGNLMELQKLAPKGAEGDISAARLANARGIKSADLGELADIGAQFLKPRVGDSGTAQRAGVYGLLGTGAYIDPLSAGIGVSGGRLANSVLGSAGLADLIASRAVNRGQIPGLQGAAGGALPLTQISPLQRLLYPSLTVEGAGGLARLGVAKDQSARP